MMNIAVYYGNPEDIRVSIDGMPPVDTRTALNQIVEGTLTKAHADPFSPDFIFDGRCFSNAKTTVPNTPRFDWNNITAEELQQIFYYNLVSLNPSLKDLIRIECIKGKSPRLIGDLKRGKDQHISIKWWNFDSDNKSLKIEITDRSFKDDAKRQPENRIFDADGKKGFWINEGTIVKLFHKETPIEKTIPERIKCDYVCGKEDDETVTQVKFAFDI